MDSFCFMMLLSLQGRRGGPLRLRRALEDPARAWVEQVAERGRGLVSAEEATALHLDVQVREQRGIVDALRAKVAFCEEPALERLEIEGAPLAVGMPVGDDEEQRRPLSDGSLAGGEGRLVERLSRRGVPVRVGARSAQPPFDWARPATWRPVLEGARAAYISYAPDLGAPGSNDAIGAFVDAALAAGVRRLVLLSGRGEDGAAACEDILVRSGADCPRRCRSSPGSASSTRCFRSRKEASRRFPAASGRARPSPSRTWSSGRTRT